MANVSFYFWALIKKLHYVLAIALAVFFASVISLRFMPPVYMSSAKILAEAPQIPSDLARSTVALSGTAQLQILQQQILTYNALLTLATKLDIYAAFPAKPSDEDIVKDLRGRITFEELNLDQQNPGQGIAVVVVSFRDSNPILAAKVANALVSMIMGRNRQEREDRAGTTFSFFDKKAIALEADLNRHETAILAFTNANRDTLPESLEFRRSQLAKFQERLSSLEREEADLKTRRNEIVLNYTSTGQQVEGVPLTPEQQMLADLNRALAEQLALYTEKSPNIINLRARIATLEKTITSASI